MIMIFVKFDNAEKRFLHDFSRGVMITLFSTAVAVSVFQWF